MRRTEVGRDWILASTSTSTLLATLIKCTATSIIIIQPYYYCYFLLTLLPTFYYLTLPYLTHTRLEPSFHLRLSHFLPNIIIIIFYNDWVRYLDIRNFAYSHPNSLSSFLFHHNPPNTSILYTSPPSLQLFSSLISPPSTDYNKPVNNKTAFLLRAIQVQAHSFFHSQSCRPCFHILHSAFTLGVNGPAHSLHHALTHISYSCCSSTRVAAGSPLHT